MPSHWGDDTPDDRIGLAGDDKARRWNRSWNQYLAVLSAVVGVMLVIGSVSAPGRSTIGGVLVVLAGGAFTVSDGPRQKVGVPPPARPTVRHELVWSGLAVVLVTVGFALFAA